MRDHTALQRAADRAHADGSSSSRWSAWLAIGALTAWIGCAVVDGWPEAPGEPPILRWSRTAAEHPLRTSLAAALLAGAAFGRRYSASAPPERREG